MRRLTLKSIVWWPIILFFGYVIYCGIYYGSEQNVTVTVIDKERINNNNNRSSYYLIYTSSETFKCTDEMFMGKFNSSDMYGHIQRNQTYQFKVIGWRVPVFSMYRNIVKSEIVKR